MHVLSLHDNVAYIGTCRAHFASYLQDIGVGPSLTVAFLAGCANVLITNPIWVVATRMQVTICNWTCLSAAERAVGPVLQSRLQQLQDKAMPARG